MSEQDIDKTDDGIAQDDDVRDDAAQAGEDTPTADADAAAMKDDATTDDEPPAVAFSVVYDEDDADVPDVADGLGAADDADDEPDAADADDAAAEGDDADADSPAPSETSAAATAANARRVNETLALAANAKPDIDADADPNEAKAHADEPEHALDQQVGDRVLLKSYPTFSLNHATTTNHKTGRHVLDDVSIACYAGTMVAIRVLDDADDPEQRTTLMAVLGGYLQPTSGTAMTKSANLAELEINELRGHRLGIVPQRYAVRGDLDAESNVRYAMDASGRTYLKPKPIIARELLERVGFSEATSGKPVRSMTPIEQRRVAIARAISCEAEVVILDEPTKGLDSEDAGVLLDMLASIAHARDPKRVVIIVTSSDEVAALADKTYHLAD